MPTLDAIDRKILNLLQTDSRMTMQELADRVGLSVSPCHRRVKLLEERGVITRYIATVDQKSLGLHVSVFISIKLARQKEEDLNRFARAISKWDEVLECYLMTGNRDYLLRVVAADLSSYEAFLKNKLTRLDGIASIESSFALSPGEIFDRTAGVMQMTPRKAWLLQLDRSGHAFFLLPLWEKVGVERSFTPDEGYREARRISARGDNPSPGSHLCDALRPLPQGERRTAIAAPDRISLRIRREFGLRDDLRPPQHRSRCAV